MPLHITSLASLVTLIYLLPSIRSNPSHFPLEHQYNKGWSMFLDDEVSRYQDIPLVWEQGRLPAWLRGSYIKNGPARRSFGGDRVYSSYMDSWGKLHKFTFGEDGVTFSGRMLETANYNKCVEEDRMVPTITIAHLLPTEWTIPEMGEVLTNLYDNTNVWLWKLGPEDRDVGQYLAVTDWPQVHEVDPDTLEVKGKYGLAMSDGVSMASSTHWRREVGRQTSLQYHMIYNPLTMKPDFTLFRHFSTWQEREVVGKVAINHTSVIHMFSNTENFAVVALYPVVMDFMAMPQNHMHPFETIKKLEEPTRFFLINLHDGSVVDGFETNDPELVFCAHHINAWEEGDEVVVDMSFSPWDIFTSIFDMENMLNQTLTDRVVADYIVKRVRLNRMDKSVLVEDWPNALGVAMLNTLEFPTINMAYSGRRNRYVYGWVSIDYWRQTLVKKDLEDSSLDKTWSMDSHYPGELFFVGRPEAEAEDDGVLLTVVFDGERGVSYLLILDAETFTEVDRSYLPYRIPFSFHGNWFPELH